MLTNKRSCIPLEQVIERLHSEMGMAEEHKKAQEEIAKLTQQLVQAQREILNWKSIADDEMKVYKKPFLSWQLRPLEKERYTSRY